MMAVQFAEEGGIYESLKNMNQAASKLESAK